MEQAQSGGGTQNSDEHSQRNITSLRTPRMPPHTSPYLKCNVGLLTVPHRPTSGGVVTASPTGAPGQLTPIFNTQQMIWGQERTTLKTQPTAGCNPR